MSEGRRYEVLGVIGKGGFGTVYRARLLGEGGFSRQVALKVLNPDMAGVSEVAQRLRDEARLLGLLRHRAIVQVDGLVRLDDRWTVVMEFVEGVDLSAVVHGGPTPCGVALEIIGEVASALHVAYAVPGANGAPLHLLHRDIKPPNILVTAVGEVKVLDFGVARADFGTREAATRSMLFGSPGYMAPERMDFEELPAGDSYSLGVVFSELLTGQPFGKAHVRPHKHEEKVSALRRSLAGHFDAALVDLLARMLSYEPTDRPEAREIERSCRDIRSKVGGSWLREWAEITVPPLLAARRAKPIQHDFSASILVERSGVTGTDDNTLAFDDPVVAEAWNDTLPPEEESRPSSVATHSRPPPPPPSPESAPPSSASVAPVVVGPEAPASPPTPLRPREVPAPRSTSRRSNTGVIGIIVTVVAVVSGLAVLLLGAWFAFILMISCCGGMMAPTYTGY